MLTTEDYEAVLIDMYRRRSALDKAISALEWLSGKSKCKPLPADIPAVFHGKWIAVDRSGDQESIIAYGDSPREAETWARQTCYPEASIREM